MSTEKHLFIYDPILQKGGPLHGTIKHLTSPGSESVAGTLSGNWRMFNLGSFHAIEKAESTVDNNYLPRITGDIVPIAERHMCIIDALVGSKLMRVECFTIDESGALVVCWVYVINKKEEKED